MLVAGALLMVITTEHPSSGTVPPLPSDTGPHPPAKLGVFLGSDAVGTAHIPAFERWLGREVTVGRTYLPGDSWSGLNGPDFVLRPWAKWRAAKPGRVLAINVPMVAPNEGHLSNETVASMLNAGAAGTFDLVFRRLAGRLVAAGAADSIIVLGWEMNGTTYSSRCAPNPTAWKTYWRRIVATMRSVHGQRFRFDFTANRGTDAIPWPRCYPGDDVVDIIGMDNYDQPPSNNFAGYVSQPYGLRYHAAFAAAHGKPISFPEWGLFRYGDRPGFVRSMIQWIRTHNVAYQAITDYCPHGVWQCGHNPLSALSYRKEFKISGPAPPSKPLITTPTSTVLTPTVTTPKVSVPAAATPRLTPTLHPRVTPKVTHTVTPKVTHRVATPPVRVHRPSSSATVAKAGLPRPSPTSLPSAKPTRARAYW
ncbi:glycosyl hydrolase [Nonomuraea sp. NPDC050536]|uniref:glycosyl hydrolase n=1 Tax=Nonomuraea sp. NPDC050536 TaxID=3364366 RepID=UPI0037C8C195